MWRKREKKHLFPLGRVTVTSAAARILDRNDESSLDLLERHVVGDWGLVCEAQKVANDWAAKNGIPARSVFAFGDERISVFTHSDCSVTEVMTLEEDERKYGAPDYP